MKYLKKRMLLYLALAGLSILLPAPASAHCDTMDGPVVAAANAALRAQNINLALIWIKPEYEKELREVFAKALSVRTQGQTARELADMYFFETVVRLHRMGEGEAYTGIKPSGTPLDPAVAAAEKALLTESADQLRAELNEKVTSALTAKLRRVAEARTHQKESLEAGRAYVAAYVNFMHFVEEIYDRSAGVHSEGLEHHP